ncbi:MAG: metalloenzyme domain-containing protein [Anaerolineae bacterium]|nr:metalloenzyme domain-containing protein [Anaerolineae bacterium]MCI0608207.1 metalloenzyme domain-containing protein [Anaerolineae bacterium]
MRVLFIFLDGIGLGENDPAINPFARAKMPNLNQLLEGRSLLKDSAPFYGDRATLLAIDPSVGVSGLPQSATGQAMLVTGINIPAELGYHYGPKPNPEVAAFLSDGTLFSRFAKAGKKSALLNAYPPRYFDGIDSGKRLYSSIPLAVTKAGLELFKHDDLFAGRALSADFTGAGWRSMLGFPASPVMDSYQAGRKLVALANEYDFSLFEYWASDYAGHKQDMETAVELMETFDGVLGGVVEEMKEERHLHRTQVQVGKSADELLVLITSDHGNMEDLSTRKHTNADVPAIVIADKTAREEFTRGMKDLTDIAPAIWRTVMG